MMTLSNLAVELRESIKEASSDIITPENVDYVEDKDVIMVSPTMYGTIFNCSNIADFCKRHRLGWFITSIYGGGLQVIIHKV